MNFDPTWLFLSLIPSGAGFVLFVYGKKQQRWPHMLAGIVFSIYPYFTPNSLVMVVVGVALGTGLWLAVRAGW
jgi:branched-subunit amino acid transport protein